MSCVYFTDRAPGKQFPRMLAEAGIRVERHGDLVAPEGSDEQWPAHCGTRGRVAITHSRRIRYVPHELAAVKLRPIRACTSRPPADAGVPRPRATLT